MQRIRVTAKQLGDRHYQINLSDRIALITQTLLRPGKNGRMARVKAGYFGFSSHDEAIAFANEIRRRFPACRMQVRQGNRLNSVWEVKVAHACVEELAWQILNQSIPTSKKIDRHVADCRRRQDLQQQAESKAQTIANAPLKGRGKPDLARCGDRWVSIS